MAMVQQFGADRTLEPACEHAFACVAEYDKVHLYFMSIGGDFDCRIAITNAGNHIQSLAVKFLCGGLNDPLHILLLQPPNVTWSDRLGNRHAPSRDDNA